MNVASPESMRAYYAQRAPIYERVYQKPERQVDLRRMEAWLSDALAGRRVLEIASGTGYWIPFGAARCDHWHATDISAETLAIARTKPAQAGRVSFAEVDAYTLAELDPALAFDAAFAGCWWSHVPLQQLPAWLGTLHQRLPSGARVVMLDNSFVQTSNLPITRRDAQGNTYQLRTLDDGSTHEVLKNFPSPADAIAALGPRACRPQWIQHPHYWVLSYELD